MPDGATSTLDRDAVEPSRLGPKTRVMLTLFDQGVVSIATYVTGVLVSRSSTPGFGLYMLVFTLWIFGTEIHNSLISTPQMIKLPGMGARRRRVFNGSLLVHQLALSGVLTLGLLVASGVLMLVSQFSPVAQAQDVVNYAVVALMAALSVAPLALRNFARSFCFTVRDIPSAVVLDVGVSVIQVFGVALAFFTNELGHHWYLAVLVVSAANVFSALLWLSTVRREFQPRIKRAIVDFRRNWVDSRFIFLSSMLWTAGIYLYVWMISFIAGDRAAGIWGACFMLANLGNPLIMGIQNMMGPAISHAFADRALPAFRHYVLNCTVLFTGVAAIGALVLALVAELLLTTLNGGEYAGYGNITRLLTLTMLLQGLSFPTSRGLFNLDRAKLDMYANIGPLVILALAGVVLIRQYGVMGAAICLVVAQATGSLSRILFFLYASAPPAQPGVPLADKPSAAL